MQNRSCLEYQAAWKITAHLLAPIAEDRRLRFGAAIADDAVRKYVRRIDFERDAVFGVYGLNVNLIGACHVARASELAEFGVSVSPAERRRGIGSALVSRAALHARNAGIGALFTHCLSENRGIVRIARKLGMRFATECGESDGRLKLPVRDLASLACLPLLRADFRVLHHAREFRDFGSLSRRLDCFHIANTSRKSTSRTTPGLHPERFRRPSRYPSKRFSLAKNLTAH